MTEKIKKLPELVNILSKIKSRPKTIIPEKLKNLEEVIRELFQTLVDSRALFTTNLYFTTKYSIEGCTEEEHNHETNVTADIIRDLDGIIADIDRIFDDIDENYDKLIEFYGELDDDSEFEFKIDRMIRDLSFIKTDSDKMLELIDDCILNKL